MTHCRLPKNPRVYAAERRALQQMNAGGLWYTEHEGNVRFTYDGCVWILGRDGTWRWGDDNIKLDPQVADLNRIRRQAQDRP
jgi:hypothetical protein